jgi:glycine amidinotransferase
LRDQVLIVGREIIETPPLVRQRYFEGDLLKPLFMEYFARGARWTVAPRPLMTDERFDPSYVLDEPLRHSITDAALRYDIMFDGANCLRFGRDIIMNVSNENHRLGAVWLQRHLADYFTVHIVDRLADNHIDGVLMPLRPGLLLVNSKSVERCRAKLPASLQRWEWIVCDDVDTTDYPAGCYLPASEHIASNVLPVDEDTVIIEERLTGLARILERRGINAVRVRLRHSRLYAGGFHCITLDVRRKGGAESFLAG